MAHFDVVIIGCGAIGSAVGREICFLHKKCLIVEKKADILDEASSGNTGHLARNFYYTNDRAPFEFAMTRRAASFHNDKWLDEQPNVPRRKSGLLFLAKDENDFIELERLKKCGLDNGEDVRIINLKELEKIEPDLCQDGLAGALFSPNEYVVDPFLLALSNLYSAVDSGATLVTDTEVVETIWDSRKKIWSVRTKSSNGTEKHFTTFSVVNCAGNFSDEVNHMNGQLDEFKITPGKGIFGVFDCVEGQGGVQSMVVPLPTKNFAGIYIFKSVYGHVIVGPTNVRQESKTDRTCDDDTLSMLEAHLKRNYPQARWKLIGTYAGLRPASPNSDDYIVNLDLDRSWITLGAIRSTGLTASRALAEYVREKLFPDEVVDERECRPMPKPEVLSDDRIKVGPWIFKVTHKISKMGLKSDEKFSSN